ncbi:HAD family hydrolase [Deinococcus maricopensis]|uniref:HAD-superfamily hydrolase, subfamily IA, variant 3 n=1 Tax=Deinococcus maricopensis (strain DSM 21211 / LMG 22137 / NRRL B-23946 / LB-34) TaxID=709986 RepID=E8U799_DEIML|nr:HAD family phosphatase [Deinococcus maricopensis]ADV66938.1 HAD-superfamily hydrolase, subfamily IA, variant 3 [Deinococcus maricopensis DSM 21211]
MGRMTITQRHVAFDWGGVFTVGTFDGRSTGRLAEHLNLPVDAVRDSYFRHVHQLEVGTWSLPQFWTVMAGELGTTLPYADFEALYVGSIHRNAPMYDLITRLPDGVRVGLLSNNYPIISDHLRADPAWARMDALVFSNEIGMKKPDPRAFDALADAMQVPRETVAFVDDVPENIAAANASGFHGLLYHHEHHAAFARELAAWLAVPAGTLGA